MKKKYDVLIVGGGTSGCACAYTAAKLGLKVLLVEKNSFLGGSITSSLVVPAMKTSKNAINNDFFNILYDELEKIGGAITYIDGNKGWFNPELTKIVLDKLLINTGVDILFESYIEKIDKKLSHYIATIQGNNSLSKSQYLLLCIESKYVVDATGDAKICQKLNCEFLDNKNKTQPTSLRFIMSGINTDKFIQWIMKTDNDRNVTTFVDIDGYKYVSTAYTWDSNKKWALKPLFMKALENQVLTEEDTNYFQIFSIAGTPDSIGFNCPRLINITEITDAYIKGRQSILRLSNFCRKYLPGFENSYISSISNSLGIRVSNRVKGKYVYTAKDLKSGKKFQNPVVISNYPIDIHSNKKDKSKFEKINIEYQLPIESLIVKDSLFVVGRCISTDFESQAALRIIPSCFSMGEGLAKYIANINTQNC